MILGVGVVLSILMMSLGGSLLWIALAYDSSNRRLEATLHPDCLAAQRQDTGKQRIRLTFAWKLDPSYKPEPRRQAKRFSMRGSIMHGRYMAVKCRRRTLDGTRFYQFAQTPSREIRALARALYSMGHAYGLSRLDQARNIVAFVQQTIAYTPDLCFRSGEPVEYPKFPLETLIDGAGDCEDTAILAAALLRTLGFRVALLISANHAALGIAGLDGLSGAYVAHAASQTRYYYVETSNEGWPVGHIPAEFVGPGPDYGFTAYPV